MIRNGITETNNEDVMHRAKPAYATSLETSTLSYLRSRTKSIQEAKHAFLNSTITDIKKGLPPVCKKEFNEKSPIKPLNKTSCQIITNKSEDSRITGGGLNGNKVIDAPNKSSTKNYTIDCCKNIDANSSYKKNEVQKRKVSFKTKNGSVSHKRSVVTGKTTVTVTNNKVAELTRKYNEMTVISSGKDKVSILSQPKVAKTIGKMQNLSAYYPSNTSTPSSTLSSATNIKIIVRQKRSVKGRSSRKRCSSVDSIDKITIVDSPLPNRKVIRTKSDGHRKIKSPIKRSLPQSKTDSNLGCDVLDGITSPSLVETKHETYSEKTLVKNVIRKLESEINESKNGICNEKESKRNTPREKPKVPEKKSSVIVTKNVVFKDGVPKIKVRKNNLSLEQHSISPTKSNETEETVTVNKKECVNDKQKYKTNYINRDKLSFQLVEIIPEDVADNVLDGQEDHHCINDIENNYEDLAARITPNESFLWRRKSSCLSNSEAENSLEIPGYSFIEAKPIIKTDNFNMNSEDTLNKSSINELFECSSLNESQTFLDYNISDANSIVGVEVNEALNESVINKNTIATLVHSEDDYEPFANVAHTFVSVDNNSDRATVERQVSKINCPLPDIPTDTVAESVITSETENIYQCLLEMRSHPEGDESSIHSYEMCDNELEERTRGDGDSDDGYEYCKSPNPPSQINKIHTKAYGDFKPLPSPPVIDSLNITNYEISKSISTASTDTYERIGADSIYEKIPPHPKNLKELPQLPIGTRDSIVSSEYTSYNDGENIYDTIKHPDRASISNCYESIPNSPRGVIKLRNNFRKQISAVQKRLSFDSMSNISRSTLSSDQKTNSIYGQRSIISFSGQEIAFQVPNSDTSVSDRSDRSEDWVDMSDQEEENKNGESKIIIYRERSRKSPVSWSQKVRHQWQNSPKQTSVEADSSDSCHYYESLSAGETTDAPRTPRPSRPPPHYDDDFDSFDSDSDNETTQPNKNDSGVDLEHAKLPEPPASTHHTLTKIAAAARRAAGNKMRELTRNFTKRHSDYGKTYSNTSSTEKEPVKQKLKPSVYDNVEKPRSQENRTYSNMSYPEQKIYALGLNKTETPLVRLNGNALNNELKEKINEKRLSTCVADVPPSLPENPPTLTADVNKGKEKDSGTLSRKTYFSFKSRFRRASSMAVDINSEVPSALKITNSTFYLTDSIDGDSGFSNCSDNGQLNGGSAETLQPLPASRKPRDSGTRLCLPKHMHESSPELTAPLDERPTRLERPTAPPPPPPTDLTAVHAELKRLLPSLSKKEKSARTRTSWYAGADCDSALPPRTHSSWYAEAGLYQEGSVSSSSGASSSASPLPHSRFVSEPLYQFYNAAKVESVCRENVADSDSDGYETVSCMRAAAAREAGAGGGGGGSGGTAAWLTSPRGPERTLWCQLPEVIESEVLKTLTPSQKRLQEAKFELVTSEASYLNSLSVLESHFINHPAFRDENVISAHDREILFDTIIPVRKCSEQLMKELEKCWKKSILLGGLCELVQRHARHHFHVYVQYCENQIYLVKTLQRLKTRSQFNETLATLEAAPACQSLSLHSFLMLPMQRVTRLPLLMDAVLRHLDPSTQEYQVCMATLATLNNFVSQCNEGARNMERMEEMSRLASVIEFPPHMRNAPDLAPSSARGDKLTRWLVRSGELTQLVWRGDEQLKLTFGKKFHKIPLWLFLFTDMLVITKKKSEESYVVVDYCQRSLIELSCGDVMTQLNMKETPGKHVVLLTLLENHDNKTVEMLMSCANETDASRWREALCPPDGEGGESVYAGWDCPQVAVLYTYTPTQPDELALAEGDIVNVTRKMPEGWYYGERIRDGETGWFPGSYTVEVASPHVRARNLRQRYRLLALSGSYLGQRTKKT